MLALTKEEQEFMSVNLEDSASSLQNFRTAFRLYIMHYTTCCEYAEQISDGELLDEYAVSYALEQLAYSYKISRLLKSRLLKKEFEDSDCALADLNNLKIQGKVVVQNSVLVLQPGQAIELANELLNSFAQTRRLSDFELGSYIKYLADLNEYGPIFSALQSGSYIKNTQQITNKI